VWDNWCYCTLSALCSSSLLATQYEFFLRLASSNPNRCVAPIQQAAGACTSASDIYYSNFVFKFSVGVDIGADCLGRVPLDAFCPLLSTAPSVETKLTPTVMLIPFPLLYKLKINRRQRNILLVIFCFPIITISFAILRRVQTNPTLKNVDPIRFQLYSMLENAAGK
jgi:hypothetical protein